jgi:predicted O-linked N-acetylglucosamine transferase (SPINDLY family)
MLVCETVSAYEEKALYIAQNPDALATIKNALTQHLEHTDLFNPKQFALSLESQYHALWQEAYKKPT